MILNSYDVKYNYNCINLMTKYIPFPISILKIALIASLYLCSNAFGKQNYDEQNIKQFKAYLNEIKSVAVDFTQHDTSGNISAGKLLINKPYKFRCNYYPPFPLVIIGNKNYVSVYDYEMEHVSRIKTQENIFNFLLVDNLDLEKHFIIKSSSKKGDKLIVTLYHKASERSSIVQFNSVTGKIESLAIIENDSAITINFSNLEKVANFDSSLFEFKNPKLFGPPARYGKEEIKKTYTK